MLYSLVSALDLVRHRLWPGSPSWTERTRAMLLGLPSRVRTALKALENLLRMHLAECHRDHYTPDKKTTQRCPPFLLSGSRPLEERPGAADFIRECAAAMLQEGKIGGRTALYLGGEALSSGRATFGCGPLQTKTFPAMEPTCALFSLHHPRS